MAQLTGQAGRTPVAPSHLAEEALGLSVCPHPIAAPWDGPVLAEPARAARWLHKTAGGHFKLPY